MRWIEERVKEIYKQYGLTSVSKGDMDSLVSILEMAITKKLKASNKIIELKDEEGDIIQVTLQDILKTYSSEVVNYLSNGGDIEKLGENLEYTVTQSNSGKLYFGLDRRVAKYLKQVKALDIVYSILLDKVEDMDLKVETIDFVKRLVLDGTNIKYKLNVLYGRSVEDEEIVDAIKKELCEVDYKWHIGEGIMLLCLRMKINEADYTIRHMHGKTREEAIELGKRDKENYNIGYSKYSGTVETSWGLKKEYGNNINIVRAIYKMIETGEM